MTAAELAAARLAARTVDEILAAEARIAWAKAHDGAECPDVHLPALPALIAWLLAPATAEVATAVLRDVAHAALLTADSTFTDATRAAHRAAERWLPDFAEPSDLGPDGWGTRDRAASFARLFLADLVEAVHAAWLPLPPGTRHPLADVVAVWQQRPPCLSAGTVTATHNAEAGAGMTRRAAMVSTLRRVHWRPDEGGAEPLVTGAVVDGEPMAAPRPDTADLFPVRKRRPRRRFQPGEQRDLPLPVVPPIPHDLRLVALADLAGDPILQGDVLALLGIAWAADRPLVMTEREGAALLARARDGRPRPVQVQHDVPRFWQTAYALRALVAWEPGPRGEPGGGYRWADLATVEVPAVRPVDRVTIGPPTWARPLAGKWTLTAEASAASIARAVSGQHGLAGRIVTGIEYRLAAGFTGRPGTVAPDLRPAAGARKASAGPVVELDWRTCLRLSGNWWDEADPAADNAARVRFNRAVETLRKRGYFVASLRAEAPAGDSVEIVDRIKPARGRPGGLMMRASARFVEAGASGATTERARFRDSAAGRLGRLAAAGRRLIRTVLRCDKDRAALR